MRRLLMMPLVLAAACGGSEAEVPAAPEATPVVEAKQPEPRRVLAADRIYYDLTRFAWYARGEPLLHTELPYQPAGNPLAASLDEMERAGEYQGVEYYRRDGDQQTLYVPVFDGYWLPFRTAATGARAD